MDAEIVVVGAGVAGAAAALAAARAGRDVVLVDPPGERRPEHGETLPPQARALLLDLAAWDAFAAAGSRPCRAHRSVWGGRLRTWDRLFDPNGCGWFIERWRLAAGLRQAAVAAGARVRPTSVRGVTATDPAAMDRAPRLDLADGAVLRAGWVVDASGRRAVVARRLGARRVRHDRLVGLCRRYDTDPDPATLVEAVPDGWWFSAPTATGLITIRFGDADLTDWRRAGDDAPPPHTRARVIAAGPADRPVLVAASTSVLRPLTGPRWVAVGDAAATHDPLSSSGLLHGLCSARAAVAAIVGNDLPAYHRHERERFDEHVRQRQAHYDVERRFSDAEFWRRRRVREAEAAARPGRGPDPHPGR